MSQYKTLGDIAEELRVMRAHGMTRESIEYSLNRVFDEPEPVKPDNKFAMGQEVYVTNRGDYRYFWNGRIVGISVTEDGASHTVRFASGDHILYSENELEALK